ncbi:hypothetical protein KFE25_007309 [Diacronema lutheri]|uniref:Uncharacterized protein n=1 Tax=Diacronema lutheri TaxID=2081491 RepID=A0A8J5XH56_DIALT|nr:hypothetical protein KFE25_007309 [Diacronema lutheri]
MLAAAVWHAAALGKPGTASDFFHGLSQGFKEHAAKPPAPPLAVWTAPPSTPPPTVSQRFESDSVYRCAAMGIADAPGCCATEGLERYCCQPCRLVWLNVTSSGLTERGRHYRVEQCLPLPAALLRTHELSDGDVVSISAVLPERCWTTRAFGAITEIGLWSSTTLALFALAIGAVVCCVFAGCPLYWKRLALGGIDLLIGELPGTAAPALWRRRADRPAHSRRASVEQKGPHDGGVAPGLRETGLGASSARAGAMQPSPITSHALVAPSRVARAYGAAIAPATAAPSAAAHLSHGAAGGAAMAVGGGGLGSAMAVGGGGLGSAMAVGGGGLGSAMAVGGGGLGSASAMPRPARLDPPVPSDAAASHGGRGTGKAGGARAAATAGAAEACSGGSGAAGESAGGGGLACGGPGRAAERSPPSGGRLSPGPREPRESRAAAVAHAEPPAAVATGPAAALSPFGAAARSASPPAMSGAPTPPSSSQLPRPRVGIADTRPFPPLSACGTSRRQEQTRRDGRGGGARGGAAARML